MKESLNHHGIILSPHVLEPGIFENSFLKSGVFNTGLFAIKRSEESYHFLNWWADRIEKACFNEPDKGFYLEQKWLDHAPVFFNIHILRHPGYNVAKWNLHQRKIERSIFGDYTANGQPLKVFHFSNILKFGRHYTNFLNKKTIDNLEPLVGTLVNQYISELVGAGNDFSNTVPWSYNYFADGKLIKMAARLAFRQSSQMFAYIANPFLESNRTFIQNKGTEGVGKSGKRKNRKIRQKKKTAIL
jgi:hypothetical protein